MRILIIDDSEDLARALARMLRKHDVTVETDPARALERLAHMYDIVLCDVGMPGINGHQVITAARRCADATITILMSGDAHELKRTSGADAVLLKPFRQHDLLGAIELARLSRARAVTTRLATIQELQLPA